MSDLLRMDYINSLGQLYGSMGGTFWPITSICVETGCSTIDVVGRSQPVHFSDFSKIKSDDGPCDMEKFYTDYEGVGP
jgi:hypothetical protein